MIRRKRFIISALVVLVVMVTFLVPIASGADRDPGMGGGSYANDGQFEHKGNANSRVLSGTSRSTDVVVISTGVRVGPSLTGMARLRVWSRNSRIPSILGFTENSFNYVTTDRAYVQFGGAPQRPSVTINGTSPHQVTSSSELEGFAFDLLDYGGISGTMVKALVNNFRASSGVYVSNPNTRETRVEARGRDLPIELSTNFSWSNADSRVNNARSSFSVFYSFHAAESTQAVARGAVRYAVWRNMDSHNPTTYAIWSGQATSFINFP